VSSARAKGMIFQGYLGQDGSKEVEVTRSDGEKKRYYKTGDRAHKDPEGWFWFVGRDDDVITTAGYRVGPFEVESSLKEHPAILESAVVASPSSDRFEIIKAYIVLTDKARSEHSIAASQDRLKQDIIQFVKAQSAAYKVPKEIEFVDQLPKTVSGKIRRVELRNLEYEKKKEVVLKRTVTKPKL